MKKIFTLIAAAFAAVAVNAADWTAPGTAPAAGTAIIDDDLMTVSTVYAGTCSTILVEDVATPVTFAGKTFKTYMQIRVDAAPSAANPTGTEKAESTPLVIVAKKNVDFTYYYRRQAVTDAGFTDNDGKDVKIVNQASPAAAIAGSAFVAEETDDPAYANTYKTVSLEAGKTYTLWARGTTGRLYGISYVEGTAQGGGDDEPQTGGDIPAGWGDVYSWQGGDPAVEVGGTAVASDGESVNYANGDYMTIRINKKKADIDTDNVQITFNEALKAGDKIAITGYRNKDTDANGTLYMLFSNGSSIDEGDGVVWNNIHSAIGQQPNTNVYDVTDAIAGSTSVKIARSIASTNVFIIKVRVARAGGSSVKGVKAADEAAPAVKKVVKDGQIIIVKDGAQYNAAGAQVK
jgi:hypothetical protein